MQTDIMWEVARFADAFSKRKLSGDTFNLDAIWSVGTRQVAEMIGDLPRLEPIPDDDAAFAAEMKRVFPRRFALHWVEQDNHQSWTIIDINCDGFTGQRYLCLPNDDHWDRDNDDDYLGWAMHLVHNIITRQLPFVEAEPSQDYHRVQAIRLMRNYPLLPPVRILANQWPACRKT